VTATETWGAKPIRLRLVKRLASLPHATIRAIPSGCGSEGSCCHSLAFLPPSHSSR
jgi:hypothetical protein